MITHSLDELITYNKHLSKSMNEKLFFVNHIKTKNYLDFGCADGTLLHTLSQIVDSKSEFIGYDINKDTIRLAKLKHPLARFYSDLGEIQHIDYINTTLILSSVIHEVYSFCNKQEIVDFWKFVLTSGFKYIVIRDMMYDKEQTKLNYNLHHKKVIHPLRKSFENRYCSLRYNRNLIHFLLKYRYEANWSRELQENYLKFTKDKFDRKVNNSQYDIKYFNHYCNQYVKQHVKKDFDINFDYKTHAQIILEKK
jgi:ubiquinone/menaquinone biosynthesis C-methylase UbiE